MSYTPKTISIYDFKFFFKIILTTDKTANPKAILTTIESSNGRYGSSFPSNAIDYTSTKHFEGGRKVTEQDPCIFTLTFESPITFSRIFYARRQDTRKGFIRHAELYYAPDDDHDFQLFKTLKYEANEDTNKPIVIHLDSTITAKKFRIKFISVDQDWVSICYLAFASEDKFIDNIDNVFTDGTWSELKKSKSEINELEGLYKKHPLYGKYNKYGKAFVVAKKILANPDIYKYNIFEVKCCNPVDELRTLKYTYILSTAVSTGMFHINNQLFDVFCENYENPGNPKVIFNRLYEPLYDHGYQKVDLQQGWSSVKNSIDYGVSNNLPLEKRPKFAAVYLSCNINSNLVKKLPRCRVDLSNQTYPVFRKGDNFEKFLKELVEYNKTLNPQKMPTAEDYYKGEKPSIVEIVGSHSIVSTTVIAGLNNSLSLQKSGKTLNDVINFYDSIKDYYDAYTGLSLSNKFPHHPRNGTYVVKYCLAEGRYSGFYAWAFYDYTAFTSPYLFGFGGWGMFHEWGHMTDNNDFAEAERTNNLFALMMERDYQKVRTRVEYSDFYESLAKIINYPNNNLKPKNLGDGEGLALYRKIEVAMLLNNIKNPIAELLKLSRDGWFNTVNKYVPNGRPDRWVVATSYLLKKNTAKFFKIHGFDVSENATNFGVDNNYEDLDEEAIYFTERTLQNKKKSPSDIEFNVLISTCDNGYTYFDFDGNYDYINGFVGKDENDNIALLTYTNQIKVMKNIDASFNYTFYPIPLDGSKLRDNPICFEKNKTKKNYIEFPVENITLKLFEGMETRNGKPENILNGIVSDDHTKIEGCYISNNSTEKLGFTVDFNEIIDLYGFRMQSTFDTMYGWMLKFKLEESLDGVNYVEIVNNATVPEAYTRYLPRTFIFPTSHTLRYLRLTQLSTTRANDDMMHLCDLRFYTGPLFDKADDSSDNNKKKLSTGATVGIVIAVIVVILLVVGAILFINKRNKSQNESKEDEIEV